MTRHFICCHYCFHDFHLSTLTVHFPIPIHANNSVANHNLSINANWVVVIPLIVSEIYIYANIHTYILVLENEFTSS